MADRLAGARVIAEHRKKEARAPYEEVIIRRLSSSFIEGMKGGGIPTLIQGREDLLLWEGGGNFQ